MRDVAIIATAQTKHVRAAETTNEVELIQPVIQEVIERSGIGRLLLEEAKTIARRRPADAIRLDAYDAPAGAGGFYVKCGFREAGRSTCQGIPLIYFELLL